MSNVGYNTWWLKTCPTVFVVKNIAAERKRVKVFNYPINNGEERDLMAIPYVSEADIRHSLLKGELYFKLKHGELFVTASNIDLLQFDNCHKSFLESVGITEGLTAGSGSFPFLLKQGMDLIGTQDGCNRTFTTVDKFLEGIQDGNEFHINIRHNGRVLVRNIDYTVIESGGPGSGYDTVNFISFSPAANSIIKVDYVTPN